MKTFLTIIATTLISFHASRADPPAQTKLVCNGSGEQVFEADFSGARYSDFISLHSDDGNMVKPLLTTAEQSYSFVSSNLAVNFTFGNCIATPTSSTILKCQATSTPRGSDWILGSYQFAHYRPVGRPSFSENVTVDRGLQVETAKLTVTKQSVYDSVLKRTYIAAHIKLQLTGQSPFTSFSITEEQTLGEIVSESQLSPFNTCAFIK